MMGQEKGKRPDFFPDFFPEVLTMHIVQRLVSIQVFVVSAFCAGAQERSSNEYSILTTEVRQQVDRMQSLAEKPPEGINAETVLERSINELVSLAPGQPETLLPQLAWYQAHVAASEPELHRMLMIIGNVRKQAESTKIIETLAPHLESSDAEFRKEIQELFGNELVCCSSFQFQRLNSYVKNKKPAEYRGLISYMYDMSLDSAFNYLVAKYIQSRDDSRRIGWLHHVVQEYIWRYDRAFYDEAKSVHADAIGELGTLVQSDVWWVRLYVAELLRQYPILRTSELMARLNSDPDRSVREKVQALKTEKD